MLNIYNVKRNINIKTRAPVRIWYEKYTKITDTTRRNFCWHHGNSNAVLCTQKSWVFHCNIKEKAALTKSRPKFPLNDHLYIQHKNPHTTDSRAFFSKCPYIPYTFFVVITVFRCKSVFIITLFTKFKHWKLYKFKLEKILLFFYL